MAHSHSTSVTHTEDLAFEVELQGHKFMVDADAKFGGKDRGPRPKPLMLTALAGCTGMDVASIVGKMRMPFDSFRVEVDGELNDDHPVVYTKVHIKYIFTGSELDESKIEKAVKLSTDKYCGVHAMMSKSTEITHEILLNP